MVHKFHIMNIAKTPFGMDFENFYPLFVEFEGHSVEVEIQLIKIQNYS